MQSNPMELETNWLKRAALMLMANRRIMLDSSLANPGIVKPRGLLHAYDHGNDLAKYTYPYLRRGLIKGYSP